MVKKKILFIFGTRPEAIKMAPLILEAKKYQHIESRVCVTGQHRELLDQVLGTFQIQPDYDLKIMRPNQSLNEICQNILLGLENLFKSESFDCVLVHGDTTTTMASSLAAFHNKIPVAHIEAGLRTYNMQAPWPEEMNRRVAGVLTTWHFAPTERNAQNLLAEGISQEQVFTTGNTVIDALFFMVHRLDSDPLLQTQLNEEFSFLDPSKKMVLVTGHRRESFGESFKSLSLGLKQLAEKHDIQLVYPVHLNPNIRGPIQEALGKLPNVFLIPPQDYVQFLYLMKSSYFIITDSGGVQEEAPSLGKPVLVMRDKTERPEAISSGNVKLVGTRGDHIYKEASLLLNSQEDYEKMTAITNSYGDGLASQRIMEILNDRLETQ